MKNPYMSAHHEEAMHVGVQKTQGTKAKQYVILRTLKVFAKNGLSKQINISLLLTPSEKKGGGPRPNN